MQREQLPSFVHGVCLREDYPKVSLVSIDTEISLEDGSRLEHENFKGGHCIGVVVTVSFPVTPRSARVLVLFSYRGYVSAGSKTPLQ
jgi:hypothetical protein